MMLTGHGCVQRLIICVLLVCFGNVKATEKDAKLIPTCKQNNIWKELVCHDPQIDLIPLGKVYDAIEYYLTSKSSIEYMLKQASHILPDVLHILEQKKLPKELALIPFVESRFNPNAKSLYAAEGIWQINPITAEHLELNKNWWYDERKDPLIATEEAARYLSQLHKRFKDDWRLAILAYNAGPGSLHKRLKAAKQSRSNADIWKIKLTEESSNFIKRIHALWYIIKYAYRYDIKLPHVEAESQYQRITLNSQVDLKLVAKALNIELELLLKINGGMKQWMTPPTTNKWIVIPKEKVSTFRSLINTNDINNLQNWIHYKVKSGDSLSTIAEKHRTYSKVLAEVNDVSKAKIYPGQILKIPVSRTYNHLAAKDGIIHKVAKGDTFWSLAREYKVKESSIAYSNRLAIIEPLQVGRLLLIPHNKEQILLGEHTAIQNNGEQMKQYKIKPGDSLWKLAKMFNISVEELQKVNNLKKKSLIKIGDLLYIPNS